MPPRPPEACRYQPEEYAVTNMPDQVSRDVVVIGGCGHVGLPLALAFADRGARVGIYDVSEAAVATVNSGRMPFAEPGADEVLSRVLGAGRLVASADPAIVATAEHVIVVIGTPVDEHLNPKQTAITKALGGCAEFLRDGQLLVLRSTVFPGVTALVEKMMARLGRQVDVAFCPERIAEGKAMTELFELPQIVSSRTPAGAKRASTLFGRLTSKLVVMSPEEAELAKLFTNVWRYIKFATANQLYMMANEQGLDFDRIRRASWWGRRTPSPGASRSTSPARTSGTCWGTGSGYGRAPSRLGGDTRLQRGRRNRQRPGPAVRIGPAPVRGTGRRRYGRRHHHPGDRGVRAEGAPAALPGQHLRPRARQRRPVRDRHRGRAGRRGHHGGRVR